MLKHSDLGFFFKETDDISQALKDYKTHFTIAEGKQH
jgi:hypothetical protein